MNTVYGIQQTEKTLKRNIETWNELHANKNNEEEMVRYNAEKAKKHKLRMIDGWRQKGRA